MTLMPLSAVVVLLVVGGTAHGELAGDIDQLTCFNDGTFVGTTSDLRLVEFREGHWELLAKGVLRLWRSPDDRVFVIGGGSQWAAIEVAHHAGPGLSWNVPASTGRIRFTTVAGVDVVTPERIYRLDAGGALTDLGETPAGPNIVRSSYRAPEILVTKGQTLVCTSTSEHEDDYVGGACQGPRGAYVYRVDFGEALCCHADVASFTSPFVCGDVVISAVRDDHRVPGPDTTQAHSVAAGRLLGRRQGAARLGSACIDGARALLVGKRDVQIVSVPRLRTLWRQKTTGKIGAVAVCGGTKAAIVLEGEPETIHEIDLSAAARE